MKRGGGIVWTPHPSSTVLRPYIFPGRFFPDAGVAFPMEVSVPLLAALGHGLRLITKRFFVWMPYAGSYTGISAVCPSQITMGQNPQSPRPMGPLPTLVTFNKHRACVSNPSAPGLKPI